MPRRGGYPEIPYVFFSLIYNVIFRTTSIVILSNVVARVSFFSNKHIRSHIIYRYTRRFAKKVPGSVIWGTVAAMFAYGMYKVHQGNVMTREQRKERRELRVVLAPYLQAEEDIRFLKARREAKQIESEIMREVPGWDVNKGVYHNKSIWVKPPINDLD